MLVLMLQVTKRPMTSAAVVVVAVAAAAAMTAATTEVPLLTIQTESLHHHLSSSHRVAPQWRGKCNWSAQLCPQALTRWCPPRQAAVSIR